MPKKVDSTIYTNCDYFIIAIQTTITDPSSEKLKRLFQSKKEFVNWLKMTNRNNEINYHKYYTIDFNEYGEMRTKELSNDFIEFMARD